MTVTNSYNESYFVMYLGTIKYLLRVFQYIYLKKTFDKITRSFIIVKFYYGRLKTKTLLFLFWVIFRSHSQDNVTKMSGKRSKC